jgi:hypothetical protein
MTGGIQAFFNATATNHLIQDFSQIIPDFLARDSDFAFDLDVSNSLVHDLRINGIKIK